MTTLTAMLEYQAFELRIHEMNKAHDMIETYHCDQCCMDYDVEEPCPEHS